MNCPCDRKAALLFQKWEKIHQCMTGFATFAYHIYLRTLDSSLTLQHDSIFTFTYHFMLCKYLTGHSSVLGVQGDREIIQSQGTKKRSPKEGGQMRIYNQGLLDPRVLPHTAYHFFIPFVFSQRARKVNILVNCQTQRGDGQKPCSKGSNPNLQSFPSVSFEPHDDSLG